MISDVPSVAPTSEPITLAEVRMHCKVTVTGEDSLLTAIITAAREYCEGIANRRFINATWVEKLDAFPSDEIQLSRWPLSSITSIQYVDEDGDTQTWAAANYQSDAVAEPPRIKPAYNVDWPTTRSGIYAAVTITYVAGYGATAASVPERYKQAILLLVDHWFTHRSAYQDREIAQEVQTALHALLGMDRVRTF